jgi:hypothetical protein
VRFNPPPQKKKPTFCSKNSKLPLATVIWNITRSRRIEIFCCPFQEGSQVSQLTTVLMIIWSCVPSIHLPLPHKQSIHHRNWKAVKIITSNVICNYISRQYSELEAAQSGKECADSCMKTWRQNGILPVVLYGLVSYFQRTQIQSRARNANSEEMK